MTEKKYAVRYLKNTYYPVIIPDNITVEDGQMILVRTEKGEEALKVFTVNSQIAEIWNHSSLKPDPLPFVRVMSKRKKLNHFSNVRRL